MSRETLHLLLTGLQVLWPLLGVLWTAGLLFQLLMIRNRKPGIKLFDRRLMYNPFNVQFFGSEYLTLQGLRWRNLSWICYSSFAAIFILIVGLFLYVKRM